MASGVEGKCGRVKHSSVTSISLNFRVNFLIAFSNFFFHRPNPQQQKNHPVADNCKIVFEEIKKDKKHRYVIFNIRDEKQIDAEVIGERDAEYDQFLEDLQKGGTGECRYGLYDFEYMHQHQGTTESSKKQKLFLLLWCPDTAKIKMKMLYASSFDALKKSLVGVQKYIQASDLSEASKESVEEKLRATDRI